jgi:peptide methionine sulfoxide reductase MsrB
VADSTAEREDIMQEKKFKVTYKNGTERIYKAYSMELRDGKLYQCCKVFVGDQGVPSVIDGSRIEKVEEVEA